MRLVGSPTTASAPLTPQLPAGIALASKDRAVVHHPFAFVGERIAKKARPNTLALLFAMLADGQAPKAERGSCTPVG